MNTVNVKALVNNIKRERPDLVASFSEEVDRVLKEIFTGV